MFIFVLCCVYECLLLCCVAVVALHVRMGICVCLEMVHPAYVCGLWVRYLLSEYAYVHARCYWHYVASSL